MAFILPSRAAFAHSAIPSATLRLRLRVAQPRVAEGRSVSSVARRATTDGWNICKQLPLHAWGFIQTPLLLIETGIIKGRGVTSYKSIKSGVINAGGKWEDSQVVVDKGVTTSSANPGDLEAFSAKIIEEIVEGKHTQRSAA
jgi:hypothetical protein